LLLFQGRGTVLEALGMIKNIFCVCGPSIIFHLIHLAFVVNKTVWMRFSWG